MKWGFAVCIAVAAIQCPTLVLHGGLDLRVSTDKAKFLYSEQGAWKRELGLLVEQIPVGRRSN